MFACLCCDNLTLQESPPGTYEICSVCFWEDDFEQGSKPDLEGGANRVSLDAARANYEQIGASDDRFLAMVRKPTAGELPDDTSDATWREPFEAALRHTDPLFALRVLVKGLRAEGMEHGEIVAVVEDLRSVVGDTSEDLLLELLDQMSGWVSAGGAL